MRSLFLLILIAALAWVAWDFRDAIVEAAHRHLPTAPAAVATTPAPAIRPIPLPPAPEGPGIFYAVERVTAVTETGVKALNPGAQVRLMYRFKDGRMRVTDGTNEFIVKPSALSKSRQPSALPPAQ